jgi:hypothetical protein
MPAVKSLARISGKWARVASVSQTEYEEGVRNPRSDWAEKTRAAEGNYERGVTQAIQRKSFGKGVAKAGTAKWQERTLTKGPSRWSEGIQQSKAAFEAGFAPYAEVIKRTNLPPRGPKGDPKNIQRVAVLAEALHAEKLSRQGG